MSVPCDPNRLMVESKKLSDSLAEDPRKKVKHATSLLKKWYGKVDKSPVFLVDDDACSSLFTQFLQTATHGMHLGVVSDWDRPSLIVVKVIFDDGKTADVGVAVGLAKDMRIVYQQKQWGVASELMELAGYEENPSSEEMDAIEHTGMGIALEFMKVMLARKHEYVARRIGGTKLERLREKRSIVTISLSAPVVQSVGATPSGGGWKMPEHQVRGHYRRYTSGKIVWVSGHKRGDPNVERKTIYKVVP